MMMGSQPQGASAGALAVIAALLEQRTGQQIAANRSWRIETALKPVMRHYGLNSIDELIGKLMSANNAPLTDTVVEAMLNQETSFFRDGAVLDHVCEAILSLREKAGGRRLRIWCAGCSTGQEPYSLAILLTERLGASAADFPEIVATDISVSAIDRAKQGKYTQFEIQRGMPIRRMIQWFTETGEEWTAKPELVDRIKFRRGNLVGDPPPAGKFDLVLCRNVLLYFSPDLRCRVLGHLADALRPEGLLVLGAGETVIGQSDALTPSAEFRGLYCRKDPSVNTARVA